MNGSVLLTLTLLVLVSTWTRQIREDSSPSKYRMPRFRCSKARRRRKRQLEREVQFLESPTHANARRLGTACLENSDWDGAITAFETALSGIHSTESDCLEGLARACFEKGDFSATQSALRRLEAIREDLSSDPFGILLARTETHLGHFENACHLYGTIVTTHPVPEARYRYARLLFRLRQSEAAREQLLLLLKMPSAASWTRKARRLLSRL